MTFDSYIFDQPINCGRSFSGLLELVHKHFPVPPTSGQQFVFFNARRDYLKAIRYDGTGYVIVAKKLDAGVFGPCASKLTKKQLDKLMEGAVVEHVAA